MVWKKSIRNVIERVWSKPDKETSYLKNPEWRGSIQNKPSNTEYIQCVVRRLRNVLH
ncbi:MAG: sporulation initiation factor Spo0A C-terminal domain-containing protein [Roseburia sp.]